MISWFVVAAILVSLGMSYCATSLAKRVSRRVGMMDVPGKHKVHGRETPLLGGSAIFAAVLIPTLFGLAIARIWATTGVPAWVAEWIPPEVTAHLSGAAMRIPQALGILLALLVLHVMGLMDDRKHLGPWIKLGVQVLAAVGVSWFCNVRVLTVAGPTVSIIVTTLWLVALTNSFNFLDNMDGLAAGVAAICTAALLAAAISMGQWFVAAWCCVLLGSLLGFLPHNFPPASIFMGDAGSLVVGFLLGVISCLITYVPVGAEGVWAIVLGSLVPLQVMAVPIYDTFSVMSIRIREGRNPMVGDNRHFSHRLQKRGMSPRRVDLTIYLCTIGTAIAATLLPYTNGTLPAALLLAQSLVILLIIALLEGQETS